MSSRAIEVVPVTRLTSVHRRPRCFRVRLADGRFVKARRLESPLHAEHVERLSNLLDPRWCPPVLARRGSGLLTEWVGGWPLTPVPGPPLLRECGALQATVHRTALSAELHRGAERRVRDWSGRLAGTLEELSIRGALSDRDARRAVELATTQAPADVSRTVVHGDFCPDNLVVGSRGGVHVVDNETLTIHAPEYDLARTWYRWPMTPEQWGHYAEGYGDQATLQAFVRHFAHWAVIVLTGASLFRLRGGTPEADYPLRRLRQVLRTNPDRVLQSGGRYDADTS